MRLLLSFALCTFFLYRETEGAMSEAQMKAALKLLRNVCQPKNKATNEQIDAMHRGDWNQDRNGMCYMHCILSMYKLITKENKFDWQAGLTAIEVQAPDSIKETAIHGINSCKDSVKTPSDKCIAAFEIAHCFYLDNPDAYFLP
ncbi:hypothetical protein WA026_014275 [Henosepilachna vigintioctopunctata]|uniref:Uncharacterized protein n=1 Tax=Henosepilachna vigintioctopunctata TaxID=420089 RepID=A0AAW1TM49_9CUCU